MELKDRLKLARKYARLTQSDVEKHTPMTQSNYSQLETGKAQATSFLPQLAELFGVNYKWLATGEGDMMLAIDPALDGMHGNGNAKLKNIGIKTWNGEDNKPEEMVAIDFYDSTYASLGSGYMNGDHITQSSLWFRQETLDEYGVLPEFAKAIQVSGDSMYPEIKSGETIAVDTSASKVFDGEIYAIDHDGMVKVKYAFRLPDGGFRLVSRNEDKIAYPDEDFSAERIEKENVKVIGQMWWQAKIRKIRRW